MIGLYYYGGSYVSFDPFYILILISALLALGAQALVKGTFSKYSKRMSKCNMTGAMVAEALLRAEGIYDVTICRTSGSLTDNYNPTNKTLNLSDTVYGATSVAAISVAAHETGHAIQHAKGYSPLSFRSALFPVANIGSKLSWIFIIAGVIFSFNSLLIDIGIVLFSAAVLFQLVTLPVEFDASARALRMLEMGGFLVGDENSGAKKVLTAAALTYVAAAATAILQLLRLIYLYGGRRRD